MAKNSLIHRSGGVDYKSLADDIRGTKTTETKQSTQSSNPSRALPNKSGVDLRSLADSIRGGADKASPLDNAPKTTNSTQTRTPVQDRASSVRNDEPSYLSRRMNEMGLDSDEDAERYRNVFRPVMAVGAAVPTWLANKAEALRLGNEWAQENSPNGPSISDYALQQYREGNLEGAAREAVENYLGKQQQARDFVEDLKDVSDRWTGYGQSGMQYATEGLDTDKDSGKLANWSLQGLNSVTQNLMDVGAAQAVGIGKVAAPVTGASKAANTARGLLNYVPFAERSFGAAAKEARDAGADLSTQLDYAVKNTAKEIGTEMMWGTGDIFRVGAFDELAGRNIRSLIRKSAVQGPMRQVLATAAELGLDFTTEAIEEAVGTLIEEYSLKRILDPNAEAPTGWDLVKTLGESAMIGGLSGAMMGGGNVLSQNMHFNANNIQESAPEIIEAAKNSTSKEVQDLAKKVEQNADRGYLNSDLQDLQEMTAEAEHEDQVKQAQEAAAERQRNPYRDMAAEDAAEILRRGNVYGSQRAAAADAETVSPAALEDIARQVTQAEAQTGRSDTVRQAVQEARRGEVADSTAQEILKSPQAMEYFGADVTDSMTPAEQTAVVKEAVKAAAVPAGARNIEVGPNTRSEENVAKNGDLVGNIADTLGKEGQAAFRAVMPNTINTMTGQGLVDRARAAAVIYNAGANGAAIESIRIQNNPLTATEMSAMYGAGVRDGRQSGYRTGEWQNNLAAGRRGEEISQRARETQGRRQGAAVQRASVRVAVQNERAVSAKEIGFSNGTDAKTLKVLPESKWNSLSETSRNAVTELKKKGFDVVLVASATNDARGGLLSNTDGKVVRGAIQGNKIFLTADHWNLTVEQIAKHEYFHSVLENTEGLRAAIVQKMYDEFSAAEILNLQRAYAEDYGWTGVDEDYVLDEILCDAFGGIDIFEDRHLFAYHVTDYSEIVREMAKGAEGAADVERTRYSFEIGRNDAAIRDVATNMDPVSYDETAFPKSNVDLVTQVTNYYKSIGGYAISPEIGRVELNQSGVKDSLGHGIGRAKAAAYKSIPDLIRKGRVVAYDDHYWNKQQPSWVLAAPIKGGTTEGFIAAVIMEDSFKKKGLYVHEVAVIKNGEVLFKTRFPKDHTGKISPSSINSILEELVNVKQTTTQKELWGKIKEADSVGKIPRATSNNTVPQTGADGNTESSLQRFSQEKDPETLRFLNGQKGVKVYRAMQLIDGELYPPMAARVRDESGKKRMQASSHFGVWERSEERTDLIKDGKFELDKANGSSIAAAYNPYFHTSASPLNDQFSSAYKRPNMVVVEGIIPESELTSGYKAPYAKDSVGETKWHAGPVAAKLKGDKARRVFLSRWFKPLRVVPDAEVAKVVAETLKGEDVAVPVNVVTPSLRAELEKAGVKMAPVKGIRASEENDRAYLQAVRSGDMATAQRMVNEAAAAAGYTESSDYQGTSAFNGSAPSTNGYFETKQERLDAWESGEFEGDSSLGDYKDGIDINNLEFMLQDQRAYRNADNMRKEAITNLRNALNSGKGTITMYRSVPKGVKESSFRNGDWVTPSRAYAVDNAKVHEGYEGWENGYRIIKQEVSIEDIWWDGNDIAEWGYDDGQGYAYRNTENNRKLLAPVTYDDNGKVIPLSERFNEHKSDARYSEERAKGSVTTYSTDAIGDEVFMRSEFISGDKVLGYMNYSIYEGTPHIKYIETDPDSRRKGVAARLLQNLQKEHPGVEIDFGMTTPSGTALLESVTYKVADKDAVKKLRLLKQLQGKLKSIEYRLNNLYEIDNPNKLQQAQIEQLGETWDELYGRIHDLASELEGTRPVKTFVRFSEEQMSFIDMTENQIKLKLQADHGMSQKDAAYNAKSISSIGDINIQGATFKGKPAGRTLAVAFREELIQDGRTSLIGKKARTAKDLAILAQVYRNPRFETMRYFFTNDSGEVVYHTGVSCGLVAESAVSPSNTFLLRAIKEAKAAGATKVFALHNHPSGDPSPSEADIGSQGRLDEFFDRHGIISNGGVIINSNRYSVYGGAHKRASTLNLNSLGVDRLLSPAGRSELVGMKIYNTRDLARLGKAIQLSDDYSAVIYLGAQLNVTAVQEVHNDIVVDEEAITDWIENNQKKYGAVSTALVTNRADCYNTLTSLMKDGLAVDVVRADLGVTAGEAGVPRGTWLGSTSAVQEIHFSEESLKNGVSETKDLLAIHNLTYDNIRASLKLGGLPSPSIAVVKAEAGHTKYGPVSFVFNKDTIDPKKNRKNKLYGADAWTPTAADARTEYPINYKALNKVERRIAELSEKVADGVFSRSNALSSRYSNDVSDDSLTGMAERLSYDDTVRAAYIADTGRELEVEYREKEYSRYGLTNEALQAFIDEVGPQRLAEMRADLIMNKPTEEALGTDLERIKDVFRNYRREHSGGLTRKIGARRGWSEAEINQKIEENVEDFMKNNVSIYTLEDFVKDAWAMYEDGGQSVGVVNKAATKENLEEAAPRDKVEEWLLKELDGVLGEPGIYNGADPYKYDGTRKSFKQTHWTYTLANIVKAMDKASARGQRAMATASGLQSVSAEEFGSIEAMREKRGRLGKVDDDAYKAREKAVEEQIETVVSDIVGGSNDYSLRSIAEEILMQAATGPKSVDGIMRTFAREDMEITREVAQEIRDLYAAAAELPTEYFEAKPQRAVLFDEVLAAVVPTDAPADIVNGLRDQNVRIMTYESGNETERVAKMNAVEGARFSEEKDSVGRALSEGQAEYFKDSKARDENGNLLTLYHGTKNGGFTVFRDWSYLTADQQYAERYKRGGDNETMYQVYADIKNPFDTRIPAVRKVWREQFYGNYSRTELQESGLPDWTDGYDLADWIEEEGLDYDAILLEEGTGRGISYVVRSSNQIKNVDNLNPTADPDIRYSEESENDSAQRAQQMQDELAKLQQDLALSQSEVDYWKRIRTDGQARVVNKADVKRVSGEVLKKWESTLKTGEITDRMTELADAMYQGMGTAEVLPLALDIADDICSNARVIADGEAYETYKDIRKYFRENKIKRVEGIGDPGFYKRNFGKIRFAKEGRAVDAMWDDWQARWGVEFFPDDVTTSQEKVMHLVEVIDSIESLYENPYSSDYAEAVEECAYSLMDDIMRGGVRYEPAQPGSAAPDVAKYNKAIAEKNRQIEQLRQEKEDAVKRYEEREAKLRDEYRQKNKETAEFFRERQELMRERLEQENADTIQYYMEREARAKELLQQVRKRRDERLSELKQHYKEVAMNKKWRRAESDARRRLQHIAKRLQNRKLPAVSRALLDQYIGDLDTSALSITGKKLDELKDLQAWYDNRKATDPDFIKNPDIERKLARLNKKRISELSLAEVVDLTQVLLNIENTINTERHMIDTEDRRDIYAQGLETISNIQESKGTKADIRDWVISNTLSPVRAVKRFTGYVNSDPMYRAVEALADGQRKMFDYQMQAYRMFDTWTKDKKYIKSLQEPVKIQGFRNGVLTEAEITKDMAIALYMHSKNDQNLAHIKDGGITIPDLKALKKDPANAYGQGATRIKLSPAMVKAIESKLSAKDKAYAAAAMKYFNETSPAAINETSEKLVGYSLAQVENYFPINTDSNFTRKEFESLQMDGTIEGMGFLKERVDAKNPIYLRGFTDVLNKSIDMNSKYVGLAIPVRNFNKLWNVTTADYSDADNVEHFTGSVKEAMNQKWGKRGVNYIEKMMTDLQNANSKSDELDHLLGKVRSNYAGAVLTLNLSVAIKQAASYPTAGAVLGGKALAKALMNPRVNEETIAKYTPLYWYRAQGFADQELGDLKSRGKQIPKLLNWIQGADLLTTKTLWKASEYYVRDNNKDLQIGSDAYYREVARIYNRVIEETQPNYTTMQRPQLLRSDSSLVQSIAMFKTQPFQNFNVLYDAVGEYEALARAKKAGENVDLKDARKNVNRAISSQVVQLAVFSAMTFIWNMFRRKRDKYEDEEGEMTAGSIFKGIGKDMVSGAASIVPFGSDVYEFMDAIVNGSTYYGFDSVTITALSDSAEAIINQWKRTAEVVETIRTGGTVDWNTYRIKSQAFLDDVSKLAGIPLENVKNLYESAYHWAMVYSEGEYMGEYRYLTLTVSPASSKVKYYALLKKAWLNDKAMFNQLQKEMLDSGYFTEKGINQKIGSWKKEIGQ